KSMDVYINGEQVGKAENMDMELGELFTHENLLYLGRSITSNNPYLDAKIHDFRLYRIPLSERQIGRIRYIALRGGEGTARRERPEDNLPTFEAGTPQLYNTYLTGVSNIEVETEVGHLPRLPR